MLQGRFGMQYGKSLLRLFPVVPARVSRRGWGGVLGLLLCFTVNLPGAISVGPSGTGVQTFETLPAATEWSTLNVPGDNRTYLHPDAAVAALTASSITNQLGTSTTNPPNATNIAQWDSTYRAILTRPTGTAGIALMATLQNDSGYSVTDLEIRYRQDIYRNSDDFPGYGVYYSLTGAAGSWSPIRALSGVQYGSNLTARVSLTTPWTPGSTLYLLWFDGNGPAVPDPAYIIDNFEVLIWICEGPGFTTQPAGTNILQCGTLFLKPVAYGFGPLAYQWYKEGLPIPTDPLQGGNPTATNAMLVISNVQFSDAAENFGYYCQVDGWCATAWSDPARVTVITDDQGPQLLSAFGSITNLKQLVLTFDEPIMEGDATWIFNYCVYSEDGQEWNKNSATLDASGKVVTLELEAERYPGMLYSVAVYAGSLHDRCNGAWNLDMSSPVHVEPQLLSMDDGSLWRYHQGGTDQGTAWRMTNFNDSSWASGLMVFDACNPSRAAVSGQLVRTPLSLTNAAWGGGTNALPTYYFRVHFNFPSRPECAQYLRLFPFIDDGAIFYLNGQEAARYRVTPGVAVPFDSYCQFVSTEASAVGTASFGQPIDLPTTNLVQGDNVLAVELKQWNATDQDITMGVILTGAPILDCGICSESATILTQPPARVLTIEGQTAWFSISASGSNLHYQWYKNGSPILNATNVSYSITNAARADSGSYTVHVWNECTSPEVVSAASLLTVWSVARLQIGYQAQGPAVIISWSGAGWVLQEAPAVTGPWEDSADQSNPQTRTVAAGSARFFRMR